MVTGSCGSLLLCTVRGKCVCLCVTRRAKRVSLLLFRSQKWSGLTTHTQTMQKATHPSIFLSLSDKNTVFRSNCRQFSWLIAILLKLFWIIPIEVEPKILIICRWCCLKERPLFELADYCGMDIAFLFECICVCVSQGAVAGIWSQPIFAYIMCMCLCETMCVRVCVCLSLCSVCVLNPQIIPYSSSHPPHLQP